MRIANNCFVTLQFKLTNELGKVLESSKDGEPLVYLHGRAGVLPVLERELEGKEAGDNFDLTISPDQGFGQRQAALVEILPRSYLESADQHLAIGGHVNRSDESGEQVSYVVTAFDDDTVTVDANHPFAGMTLRFQGAILDVRQGTAEELAQH